MFDAKSGVIVGGNYENPPERNDTFAMTFDGGAHWSPGARPGGFRSGAVYLDRQTVVAVGTNGSDISYGRAVTWDELGKEDLNAVGAKGRSAVWAVGPKGNVFRLDAKSLQGPERGVVDPKYYPHLINITAVELGHSTIANYCASSDKSCSSSTMIEVRATGPEMDDLPHEYAYVVSAGKIIGDGPTVKWDLAGAKPGKYTITSGIRIPLFRGTSWGVVGKTQTMEVTVK